MSEGPQHWPFFCEENVWYLLAAPALADAERHALIISNRQRRVAVWGQRLSKDPSLPIAWDYHVVALFRRTDRLSKIWDLDGRRPEPRPALTWLRDSFRGEGVIPPEFLPRFRLVDGASFRRHLRSDRRHMRDDDGAELEPHPPWPPIIGEPIPAEPDDHGHNLDRFLDTEDPSFLGQVFDLEQLRAYLTP